MKMPLHKGFIVTAILALTGCYAERDIYPPVTRKELTLTHLHKRISFDFFPNSLDIKEDELGHSQELLTPLMECKQSILVTIPSSSNKLTQQRINKIKKILIKNGLKLKKTDTKEDSTMVVGNKISVDIEAYRVIPPVCSDWSRPLGLADQSITYSNFGCATALNLYASIQDPIILFKGHKTNSSESGRQNLITQDYRARKKLELKVEKLEKQN